MMCFMDKFPFMMLLGIIIIYMMMACDGYPAFSGAGNYFYICNRDNDKCLTSATVNPNRVYAKDLDLHWEAQQHFVWKVDRSGVEYTIRNVAGGSYDPENKVYLSTNSNGDYVDLYKIENDDLRKWNIQRKGSANGRDIYHIYNEQLYKDPMACPWSFCTAAHLYTADNNEVKFTVPGNRDYEYWYFIEVDRYHNLGFDPSSNSMTQCQCDCDDDNDCANGYTCYERHYGNCGTDCVMPKQCFIDKGETSYAGPSAWDLCISNTV